MPTGTIKYTKEDKEWSRQVRERDDNACVICGRKSGEEHLNYRGKIIKTKLSAHHILPRQLKGTKHDISNGISLCGEHHKYSGEISAHKNPLAFFLWMEIHRPEILEYLQEKCYERN